MEYKNVTLATINQGAAVELFAEEFKKALVNINDISVDAESVREIKLIIRIEPSADRQSALTTVQCTSKLPGVKAHGSAIHLAFRDNKAKAFVGCATQGSLFEPKKAVVTEEVVQVEEPENKPE